MKFNSILMGTTALAFSACTASAQGLVDWTGFYAGAEGSLINGTYSGIDVYDLENSGFVAAGLFAGYNMEMNGAIVGAELAWSQANYAEVGDPDYRFTGGLIDAKVKVGVPMGNWLPYVVLGGSAGDFDYSGSTTSLSGAAYGIGVSRKITDNLFIGAEFLQRNMSGDFPGKKKKKGTNSLDADFRTLSIRVGYEF